MAANVSEEAAAIADVLAGMAPCLRDRLLAARAMIREVAEATPGTGPLTETLKWGQPAFLTAATGSRTTLRLGTDKKEPDTLKLYVPCQTDLIEQFHRHYGGKLMFSGKRAIVLRDGDDEAALRHCIALALTYHARRKQKIIR